MPSALRFDHEFPVGGDRHFDPFYNGTATDPTVYHVLVIGQSNATGIAAAGAPVSTVVQPGRPFAWMFNGGPNCGGAASQLAQLVPLTESASFYSVATTSGETVCWGLAYQLSKLSKRTIVCSVNAITATAYSSMAKGTATYNQALNHVRNAKALAARWGRPYRVLCLVNLHGEADQAGSVTDYATRLATWQSDYDADIRAITGQGDSVPMYFCQHTHDTPSNGGTASTAKQGYDAWKANPSKLVLIGARQIYNGQQTDGSTIHVSNYGERIHGHRYANAIYRRQFLGEDWRPVAPIAGQVTLSGSTITAEFYAPSALALDYAQITKNGATLGFSYFDDTSPPTITAVALTGPRQLQFTLSGAPTGTAGTRVLRGGWGSGSGSQGPQRGNMRMNVRDTETEVAFDGSPLHNWMSVFQEAVT